MDDVFTMLLLFVAAILGGALNAVAGGGSFLSFPALIVAGIPPIAANATSTVALWPGSAASVGAYRAELAKQDRTIVVLLSVISLIGGLLGAVLLLLTPDATFTAMIPYLMLAATLILIFGRSLTKRLQTRRALKARTWGALAGVSLFQLAVALYGGYFGGGIGILMLAALGLLGMENIHEMNSLKTLFAVSINGVAVLTFVIAGVVFWPQAIVMVVGAVIGGYGCASFARKIAPERVRVFVILVGVFMTAYFFIKG